MIFYRELTPDQARQLPAEQLRLAADVLTFAASELAISPNPEMVWFEDSEEGAVGSFAQETGMAGDCEANRLRIRIHANLTGVQLIQTLAHEARHAWQYINDHSPSFTFQITKANHKQGELDAESYALSFATRFYAKIPCRVPAVFGPDRYEVQNLTATIASARMLMGRN